MVAQELEIAVAWGLPDLHQLGCGAQIHGESLKFKESNKKMQGTSLVIQWLRLFLPMQREWVQSLVGELRTHKCCGQKNEYVIQKQYCNEFNEDFKNGQHQNKKFFKSIYIIEGYIS